MLAQMQLKRYRKYVNGDVQKYRKAFKVHKGSATFMLKFGWLVWFAALALFIYKITQTSSFALEYSSKVHEEIGYWVIGLIVGLLGGVAMQVAGGAERQALETLRDELLAELNKELADVTVASEKQDNPDSQRAEFLTRKGEIETSIQRLQKC